MKVIAKKALREFWAKLYREHEIPRVLMDTASASSLVTVQRRQVPPRGSIRVNNGSINVGPNGVHYKPILQKFKEVAKSVGCVTAVPISHATPAGFCVSHPSRNEQEKIVENTSALSLM